MDHPANLKDFAANQDISAAVNWVHTTRMRYISQLFSP